MKKIGLGDLAYYAFRPLVYAIDWVWGTDLKDCEKCKKRRAAWNGLGAINTKLAIALGATFIAYALF